MRRSVEGKGTRWTRQGLSGRKTRNLKVVGLVWINVGGKDQVLYGGRYEMVLSSCFEDLKERVALKEVREFIPKVGKKRNGRVKVSSDS